MLVAVMLALAAYVPTCFCWTDSVAAWMLGGANAAGQGCCGEHDSSELCHQDGDDGHQQPGPPGCLMDCVCGVQHRIVMQPTLTVLDFEPAVVGLALGDVVVESGLVGVAPGAEAWMACGVGAGERTLLRLHCALTV